MDEPDPILVGLIKANGMTPALRAAMSGSDPLMQATLKLAGVVDDDPSDGPSAEETAQRVLNALGVLFRQIRQTKALGDLTLPEASVLGHLRRYGPMTSARLAKQERISPQSMGTTVTSLTVKGLVERTPDPDDGRRVLISLSESGAETASARRDSRMRQLTSALERLSSAERAQLLELAPLLERVAENLHP